MILQDRLNMIRKKPLKILLPGIYAALFTLFLAIAAIESLLPFTISIPAVYTADIPLGLYLAYLISYPGVYIASFIPLDTASLIYPLPVFLISLLIYFLLGIVLERSR